SPCLHGFISIRWADNRQITDGAQGREDLDWLVSRAGIAQTDRVVSPHVVGISRHQCAETNSWELVLGEDQEGAAVYAGVAVQSDTVHDCSHRVLTDTEVQVPAGVRIRRPHVGGDRLWAKGRCTLDDRVVRTCKVSGATPHFRQLSCRAWIAASEALRVATPLGSASQEGRSSAKPSGNSRAARRSNSALFSGVALAHASNFCCQAAFFSSPRSASLRVCAITSSSMCKLTAGSKPRISLVAATSSSPKAAPWTPPVFILFGAG